MAPAFQFPDAIFCSTHTLTDRQTVGTGTDPQPPLRSLTKLRPRSTRARGRAPQRLTSGLGSTTPQPRCCRGALGVVVVAVVVLDACGGGGVGGGGVVQPGSRVPLGPLSRLPPAWCRACPLARPRHPSPNRAEVRRLFSPASRHSYMSSTVRAIASGPVSIASRFAPVCRVARIMYPRVTPPAARRLVRRRTSS